MQRRGKPAFCKFEGWGACQVLFQKLVWLRRGCRDKAKKTLFARKSRWCVYDSVLNQLFSTARFRSLTQNAQWLSLPLLCHLGALSQLALILFSMERDNTKGHQQDDEAQKEYWQVGKVRQTDKVAKTKTKEKTKTKIESRLQVLDASYRCNEPKPTKSLPAMQWHAYKRYFALM